MTRFHRTALTLAFAVIAAGAFYLLRETRGPSQPSAPRVGAGPESDSVPRESPPPSAAKAPEIRKVSPGADLFELLRGLAKAAYDGDGRAQYEISRELDRCEMTLALVRKREGDPESLIWALPESSWSQPMKEGAIKELRRCIRLLKEDPFADLPPRQGGYNFRYWAERSVESGYPLAVVDRTLADWSRFTDGGTLERQRNNEALGKLTTAAASGDPEIALAIGFRQSAYENPARATSAAGWMLAACRLGADCSSTSKSVPFWLCYDPNYPSCSVDGNVELMVSGSLSPAAYADAYAQSQVIEEALRSRDPDAIRKLLEKLL